MRMNVDNVLTLSKSKLSLFLISLMYFLERILSNKFYFYVKLESKLSSSVSYVSRQQVQPGLWIPLGPFDWIHSRCCLSSAFTCPKMIHEFFMKIVGKTCDWRIYICFKPWTSIVCLRSSFLQIIFSSLNTLYLRIYPRTLKCSLLNSS